MLQLITYLTLRTIKNIVPIYNLVFRFFHRNNVILKEKKEKRNLVLRSIKVVIPIYNSTTLRTYETL